MSVPIYGLLIPIADTNEQVKRISLLRTLRRTDRQFCIRYGDEIIYLKFFEVSNKCKYFLKSVINNTNKKQFIYKNVLLQQQL